MKKSKTIKRKKLRRILMSLKRLLKRLMMW